MRALLAIGLAAVAAIAGCVNAPAPTTASVVDGLPAGLALPALDARAVLDEIISFSEAFPRRHSDSAAHNAARDHLEQQFADAGLEAVREELEADPSPLATPTGVATGGRLVNICGILWGEDRESFVVVGGHYDVTELAHYGAYDDGSGTMLTLHLARAFAEMAETRTPARTGVFCAFDGEEQGLRGSNHMAQAIAQGTWLYPGTVAAMVNVDMAGIAYPSESPLVIDIFSPELDALVKNVTTQVGYPEGAIEYRGITAGRSDYGSFVEIQAPTVFFISAFDDVRFGGVQYPDTYPWWHQLDTYEGMVMVADGEENLEAGFQNLSDVLTPLVGRVLFDPSFTPSFEDHDAG